VLKFIIYEDSEPFKTKIKKVVENLMLPMTTEYKTLEFSKYDKLLETTINKDDEQKIYILGIAVGNVSGLDVAKKIRDNDWKSIIIILSAHYDLIYTALKTRLMLLDFISKFDNYEKNLLDTLKIALLILNIRNLITLEYNYHITKIDLDSILYITTDTEKRRIVVRTRSKIYYSNKTLSKIKIELPDSFKYSHRACIVNSNNIKGVNLKSRVITFKNDEIVALLSEKHRKKIIEICKFTFIFFISNSLSY